MTTILLVLLCVVSLLAAVCPPERISAYTVRCPAREGSVQSI